MPADTFDDHVEVQRINATKAHVRGKTWQGRDFLRLLDEFHEVRDYDDDPWLVIDAWQAMALPGLWRTSGYVSTKQPQTSRIHT